VVKDLEIGQGALEGACAVLLDWDVVSLAQGGFAAWRAHIRGMTIAWFQRLHPLEDLPQAHIEPMGNAYSIIETVRAHNAREDGEVHRLERLRAMQGGGQTH
jgi:hypothetical protein